jgi:hypothetical protein
VSQDDYHDLPDIDPDAEYDSELDDPDDDTTGYEKEDEDAEGEDAPDVEPQDGPE